LKFLNNSKQANLFSNNTIRAQLQSRYITHFKRDKRLQKEIKYKIEIYTRKYVKINYKDIQNNIDKNVTSRNQHNVNRYLSKQANTKIDNKYKVAYCKRCYSEDNTMYLQQLDL